jgi:thiamine-monophosphate kinase
VTERDVVRTLARLFATGRGRRRPRVGIGDDAAVLGDIGRFPVWTVDTSVEGVHFDRRWLRLDEIGARSFHAAASDLAAMGARPVAALSSLIVPKAAERDIREIARGQAKASRALGCPIVGGNLARGSQLSVTTTVLGVAPRPLERSGARPGDEVWLVGEVGLAAAGLAWLNRREGAPRLDPRQRRAVRACVEAFRAPRALLSEGRRLVGRARAAIDVSDGLASDARHLAEQSRVRVVLERAALEHVLARALVETSALLGKDPLALALTGGEDYALLATGSSRQRPRWARRIGRVERGKGLVLEAPDGTRRPVEGGFDHFARGR